MGEFRPPLLLILIVPLLMLGWVALRNAEEDRAAAERPFHGISGVRSQAESDAAARLLSEAREVLRSPEFRRNMASLDDVYPHVYARASAQEMRPSEVARLVNLEVRGARYAPVEVFVTGSDDPTDPAAEQAQAGEGPGAGRFADMVLGRAILAQHQSADAVERSCAINVAAHEYAHTISTLPVKFSHAFTDTNERRPSIAGRRHPESPVGSYLIGAVAQCTYLERQGRLGGDGLRGCLRVFGVRSFNWSRCRAFAGGQRVAPRPGLPPEAPPL